MSTISQQFFLDAASLGAATSIFVDSSLTVCAPDGYYSDGVITRQQVGCVLLPEEICPECGLPCDSVLTSTEAYSGVFKIDSNMGTSTGAILLWFNPQDVPEGVMVVFNSQTYNKFSSPIYGKLKSTNPYGYTYIGKTASDCGISGSTYPALPNYMYDGTAFVNQGTTQTVTVAPGDVNLKPLNPGRCLMVIPKPSATAAVMNIYIVGPCATSAYQLELYCPQSLTPIMSTTTKTTSALACSGNRNNLYYFASLTSASYVQVNDYVFYESYGQTPLPDGFYGIDNSGSYNWIQVQDGIVIAIGTCSSCADWYICNTSNHRTTDCTPGGVGKSIRLNWVDCGSVNRSITLAVGACTCIQTTPALFASSFSASWVDACIPGPSGPDYTVTYNGCP